MKVKITEKDKIILQDSGIAVADAIVSSIPGLNIPWNLSKALYGAGMKLRVKKAVEWVEMIRDNPNVFTQDLWDDENFQDGFVVALENYLTERSEENRRIARNIFLGFAESEDKERFPLERYSHTLSQLSEVDLLVLSDIDTEQYGENYQIYGDNTQRISNIYGLINLGILLNTTGSRSIHNPQNSPFVRLSPFGIEFIEYLKR